MGSSLLTSMLERCAQAIEKVIVPNLTDDFACEQAALIAATLHLLAPEVEEKAKDLIEENEGMKEVLGRVLEVLRREKAFSSNAAEAGLIEAIALELQKAEITYPDISEENYRLKGTLVKTIKGLDALKDNFPIELMSSLRQQIRSVLRQQVDHALARVAGFDAKSFIPVKS